MDLPKQVDSIRVEVLVRGQLQFGNDYEVGGEKHLRLPATLTLLAGKDPTTPVTVRVIGKKGSRARTLRETTTTVPADRVASLPMPIQWLCDDRLEAGADSSVSSSCGEGFTCSGGRCVERDVPEPELTDYEPAAVFGGADDPEQGTCFDTLACMQGGLVAEPDGECTIAKPKGGLGVNVALRVVNDGICDDTSETCFVPLPANSDDGFRELAGRLSLPVSVCDRLQAGRVSAIVVSTRCQTRPASNPVCGSWSSVTASVPPPASPEPEAPQPTAVLAESIADDGETACCPLLVDSERFYGCVCKGGRVDVMAFDADRAAPARVASFTPTTSRTFYNAAVSDGTLYWVDRVPVAGATQADAVIEATSLSAGSTRELSRFTGDVLDDAMILVDAATLYLIPGLFGTQGEDALVLAVDRETGETIPYSTGDGHVAVEYAQDDTSLYVASSSDSGSSRTSRLQRIAKRDASRETISEITVSIPPKNVEDGNGYSGIVLENGAFYVVSTDSSGTSLSAKLVALDDRGQPDLLYTQAIDSGTGNLRPLGAAGAVVILARPQETTLPDGTTAHNDSVLLVPKAGGAARVLATFFEDGPVGRLQAPEFDPGGLYWLNQSGKLFRLDRQALGEP